MLQMIHPRPPMLLVFWGACIVLGSVCFYLVLTNEASKSKKVEPKTEVNEVLSEETVEFKENVQPEVQGTNSFIDEAEEVIPEVPELAETETTENLVPEIPVEVPVTEEANAEEGAASDEALPVEEETIVPASETPAEVVPVESEPAVPENPEVVPETTDQATEELAVEIVPEQASADQIEPEAINSEDQPTEVDSQPPAVAAETAPAVVEEPAQEETFLFNTLEDVLFSASVQDKDGNPISGVKVEVKNPDGQMVTQGVTNAEGLFPVQKVSVETRFENLNVAFIKPGMIAINGDGTAFEGSVVRSNEMGVQVRMITP